MNRLMPMLVVSLLVASLAVAQDPSNPFDQNSPRIVGYGAVQRHGAQTDRYVQKMVNTWKETKEADKRETIEKSLRDALNKEFAVRLAAHEQEVKDLEEKVRQLRERLALRKEKQDEIVDNRMQQLLRDAQGLGWGTDTATNSAQPSYFVSEPRVITPYVVPAPTRVNEPTPTPGGFRRNSQNGDDSSDSTPNISAEPSNN
jgi:hypothetical protein